MKQFQLTTGALLCAPALALALSCAAISPVSVSKALGETAKLSHDQPLVAIASMVRPGMIRVDLETKDGQGCGITVFIEGKTPERGITEIRCAPSVRPTTLSGTAATIVDGVVQEPSDIVTSFKVALTDVRLDFRPGKDAVNSACFIGLFPDQRSMHGCFYAIGLSPADDGRGRGLKK